MDTKKLRQKILDLAIHGKLVPQDPNDEPASVLLERIRKEKEQLIKEGKIKAPKKGKSAGDTSHYPKEVPWELPEGWCWCKITDVVDKLTDGTHNSPKSYPAGAYMYVTAKNIKSGGLDLSNITYVNEEVHREIYNRCNPEKGDILYIKDGATCGISTINNLDVEFSLLSSVALIKPNKNVLNTYLNLFLQSAFCYRNVRESMKGVGITRIILKQMELWDIPLPPYAEQNRIVTAAEQLLQIAGGIEREQIELGENIEKAKARILDLTIHGKLVPQDPYDEPAIELLKRINPNFTPSDNLHYEGVLPIGWSLTRLGDVIDIISGTSYHKSDIVQIKSGIRILRGGNIQNGKIVLRDDDVFVHERLSAMYLSPCRGDIALVASTGSSELIGKSAIAEIDYPNTQIGAFLRIIRPKAIELAEYLGVIFQSNYYKNHIRDVAKGTNINNIKSIYITDFVVPIPPIDEQRRILQHLKALFTIANQISDSIDESQ